MDYLQKIIFGIIASWVFSILCETYIKETKLSSIQEVMDTYCVEEFLSWM